jgi:hypothetical protein
MSKCGKVSSNGEHIFSKSVLCKSGFLFDFDVYFSKNTKGSCEYVEQAITNSPSQLCEETGVLRNVEKGFGTWTCSLTLKVNHILRVLENEDMRIFGPSRQEINKAGENYVMKTFMIYTLNQMLLAEKMKANKVGDKYDTHGRGKKCKQNFSRKTE